MRYFPQNVIFVLAFTLLAASTASDRASASTTLFLDNFENANVFNTNWVSTSNSGVVETTAAGLSIKSNPNGCPTIQTKNSPFPTGTNWTVTFGFRFSTIGCYGTEVACAGPDGKSVFDVHEDNNGQFVQMNGKNLVVLPGDTNWHVFSVLKTGQAYLAYMDGKSVGSDTVTTVPSSVIVRGGYENNGGNWSNIDLQFVRIDSGGVIYDKTSIDPLANPGGKTESATSLNKFGTHDVPAEVADKVYISVSRLAGYRSKAFENWYVTYDISNNSDVDYQSIGDAPSVDMSDGSIIGPLIQYDPDTSVVVGVSLEPHPEPLSFYVVKAHTQRQFYAYGIDFDTAMAPSPIRYSTDVRFDLDQTSTFNHKSVEFPVKGVYVNGAPWGDGGFWDFSAAYRYVDSSN